MMTENREDYRSAWLGSEAHVRFYDGRSVWSRLLLNKHGLALALAFLAGAASGGGAAALTCAKRLSEDKSKIQRQRRTFSHGKTSPTR